ncbi:MAG: hypothetical protein ABW202_00670 [Duganella sp.]
MSTDNMAEVLREVSENERRVEEMEQHLHAALQRMARIEQRSQETRKGVADVRDQVAQLDIAALRDMAETMKAVQGLANVLGWLERPAKWLATMAGLAAALYGLWSLK